MKYTLAENKKKILQAFPTIKEHQFDELARYVDDRLTTGGFLRAILENRLFDAVACIDKTESHVLFDMVVLIYSYVPSGCYGSREAVFHWLKRTE